MSYNARLVIATAALAAALVAATSLTPAGAQTAPATTAAIETRVGLAEVNPALLSNGYRVSKIIGSNVMNDQNEKVGVIDDVIISPARALRSLSFLSAVFWAWARGMSLSVPAR